MGILSKVKNLWNNLTSDNSGQQNDLLSYIAGAGFGALGSMGTSILNNYFSRKAGSKEYQYTRSLMDYQNAYNEPLAQRQRLEEAGFNPNLFYSTGANTSASGNVSVQAAKASPIDLLAAYNLEAQNELLGAQRRLIDTQIDNWEHDHGNPYKDLIEAFRDAFSNKDSPIRKSADSWSGKHVDKSKPAPYKAGKFYKYQRLGNYDFGV